jgi:hypothetical protein
MLQSVALCASVVALAACGASSSGVPAAAYVKSVCTAAATWKTSVVNAGVKLQSAATLTSLTQTKSGYVAFIGTLETATGNAADQLVSAGTPSVSGGKSIATTLVGIFSKAKTSLAQAASEANGIPTTSKSAFNAAASKVQTHVRNSLVQMSSVTPTKNPQLRSAAANDPTCKRLASGA